VHQYINCYDILLTTL